MIEVSVVSEIAGSSGRSRSKRPTISAEKCCASAAEPPLPQASSLPSASRQSVISAAARTICGAIASAAESLSSALSAKCALIRDVMSIEAVTPAKFDCSNNRLGAASAAREYADRRSGKTVALVSTDVDVDQPFDPGSVQSVEQYGIEAARRLAGEAREKETGGELESASLGGGDAGTSATEGAAAA